MWPLRTTETWFRVWLNCSNRESLSSLFSPIKWVSGCQVHIGCNNMHKIQILIKFCSFSDIQGSRSNAWIGLFNIDWRMDQTRHPILSVQKLRFDLCSLFEISKLRVTGTVSQRDQPHFLSTTTFQSIDSPGPIPCSIHIPIRISRLLIFQWNTHIQRHFATGRRLLYRIIAIQTIDTGWYGSTQRWSCYEYFFYYFLFTNDIAHFCLLHWRVLAARAVLMVAQQDFLRVWRAIDSLTVSQNS